LRTDVVRIAYSFYFPNPIRWFSENRTADTPCELGKMIPLLFILIASEQKRLKASIAASDARLKEIERLYERVYEDNVNGKVTDDWFMKLTHKYEAETEQTQKNIISMQNELANLEEKRGQKDSFLRAVRRFMEMKTLNPIILKELIEKIEVYHVEGSGKNKTQRIVIHYRFVGCLTIPEWYRKRRVSLESRSGVEVNFLTTAV